MKNINVNKEWSWIFSEGLGKAYGEFITSSDFEILTLNSAKPFFYFVDKNNIKETSTINWNKAQGVYGKEFNPNNAWGPKWTPPPLKKHFQGKINPDKPIITIINKYNKEWGSKPFNYIAIDPLDKLITRIKNDYQVYYIRQDKNLRAEGYWDDVLGLEFKDHKMIRENHPEVITIYDYLETHDIGFNDAQLEILGDTTHVITVAGGSAILGAYFGEELTIFNCKSCKSAQRGIWETGSWLKIFNQAKVVGFKNYDDIIDYVDKNW